MLLAGTLLARLARLPPPLRSVCSCSLAPAITLAPAIVLAEITWDLKAKVFCLLVSVMRTSLLALQDYKTPTQNMPLATSLKDRRYLTPYVESGIRS